MKGISREFVPYVFSEMLNAEGLGIGISSEHMTKLDIYVEPAMIDASASEDIRSVPRRAPEPP